MQLEAQPRHGVTVGNKRLQQDSNVQIEKDMFVFMAFAPCIILWLEMNGASNPNKSKTKWQDFFLRHKLLESPDDSEYGNHLFNSCLFSLCAPVTSKKVSYPDEPNEPCTTCYV